MSEFAELIGQELGPSEWLEIDQARIDALRRGDRGPPVDPHRPGRGRRGPLRHDRRARLPDALAARPAVERRAPAHDGDDDQLRPNKVRFPAPVPSGTRIRARFPSQSVEQVPGGEQGACWPRSSARAATSRSASPSSSLRMLR